MHLESQQGSWCESLRVSQGSWCERESLNKEVGVRERVSTRKLV